MFCVKMIIVLTQNNNCFCVETKTCIEIEMSVPKSFRNEVLIDIKRQNGLKSNVTSLMSLIFHTKTYVKSFKTFLIKKHKHVFIERILENLK